MQTIGAYTDNSGARHEVGIDRTSQPAWRIVDRELSAEVLRVIETLDDERDGLRQAEAIARDYLLTAGAPRAATGPATGEPIPEERGSDDSTSRRPRPTAHHQQRARGVALPSTAR
jgi:hypothetical protein